LFGSEWVIFLLVREEHERFDIPDRLDRCDHVHSFFPWSTLTAKASFAMSYADPGAPPAVQAETSAGFRYIQWGPVIAGALLAAALALVLHAFAAGLGLSMSSTAPTWRDASFALVFLSGLYLLLVALLTYGLGAYVAGRFRTRLTPGTADEVEFRDGMHGLMVWAVATLLTALIVLGAAQAVARLAAPSAGQTRSADSVAGENLIAYDLDRLLRSERPPQGDITYTRSEAARVLLTASSHRGIQDDDRAYLVRLVTSRAGLAQPEAERRVNETVARVKDGISRARKTGVILAFMAGASALLGAAIAWFAACAGGRDRDGEVRSMLYGWWHQTWRDERPGTVAGSGASPARGAQG
jgi:hypothetical protein